MSSKTNILICRSVSFVSGIILAVMSLWNAEMGRSIGPVFGCAVTHIAAIPIILVLLICKVWGRPNHESGLLPRKKIYYGVGIISAGIVVLSNFLIPHIGLALFISSIIAGNLITSFAADFFSFQSTIHFQHGSRQYVAMFLALSGVVVSQMAVGRQFANPLSVFPYTLLALGNGALVAVSRVMNSNLAGSVGMTRGLFINHAVAGLLALVIGVVFIPSHIDCFKPYLLLASVMGIAFVVAGNYTIPRIGVLVTATWVLLGQLAAGWILSPAPHLLLSATGTGLVALAVYFLFAKSV